MRTRRRLWWPAVAAGAVISGSVAYYTYRWLYPEEEVEEELRLNRPSELLSGRTAPEEPEEAEKNLQNHFQSIQRISDSTTLPQMLQELEAGLDRVANVDILIAKLRQASGRRMSAQTIGKVDVWQELKVVAWARTLSCAWLVGLADLLLRVQLNILGRHIFLQTHLLDPSQYVLTCLDYLPSSFYLACNLRRFVTYLSWVLGPATQRSDEMRRNGWGSQVPARRVTGRAQELFIEYAHYLPEQASGRFVARMRELVAKELGSMELSKQLDAATLLSHISRIHSEFEAWAVDQGWAKLMLPTQAEALEYFHRFRTAPPDTGALGREYLESDEKMIQGMVDELHGVLGSARFSSAALVAVQQAAGSIARHLQSSLGERSEALAKLLPKMTAAGNSLFHTAEGQSQDWLDAISELPQVQELCASVYCCGPAN